MSETTLDRRKKELDKWKSTPPQHNGWWYYQYFTDPYFQREGKTRR